MLTAVISIMDKSLKAPNLCKIKMSKKKRLNMKLVEN